MGSALDPDTLASLDSAIEVDMLTPRRDGSVSSRPIWVVVAGGEAYIRSYLGARGAWYQRALADRRAALRVDGTTIEVELEPERDPDVNRHVSEAFEAKYAAGSPGPTRAMVGPEVSETTLRLRSAG